MRMIIADYDLCVCSRFFVPQRKPTLQFTGSQGNLEKLQSPPYNCSARCYQVRAVRMFVLTRVFATSKVREQAVLAHKD